MTWLKDFRRGLIQSILEIEVPKSIAIQGNPAIYNFENGTHDDAERAHISCLFHQKTTYFLKILREYGRK